MAFVSERRIAIGNALERAKFEIINAQEAKAQAMDDKTLLWHIYKAQKGLKEAAALLVERQPIEQLSLRGKAEAIDHAEQSEIVDCHEATASSDDALYGNEQSPQSEHVAERGAVDCPSKAERVPLSYREATTMFIKQEATRIKEMHRAFDKWLENTKALIKMCDNPEPLKKILDTQIRFGDSSLQGVSEEWKVIQTFQEIEKPMFFRWLEETKALIKMCDNPEPLKKILDTQIQRKYNLQEIMKSVDKIREENQ